MIASVGVLCCAKTEDMNFKEKCGSCCMVFGIGILQLLLVACFLIGWIWSCIWGITFIGMSSKPKLMSMCVRIPTIRVPTRSDTNRAVPSQKKARSLKLRIQKEERLYYPCSENKGADQLRGYREADLRLCFRL